MSIPKILFRTVGEVTDDQTEAWWARSVELTPGWHHITYRDPADPEEFPYATTYWHACNSGAQRAGIIRLEALMQHGGLYLDSDVELWKDPTPLLDNRAIAAWEDANTIPDAILGFEPDHAVLPVMLDEALRKIPEGAWESGPGVTTRNLAGRDDVTLLPTEWLYPFHWKSSVKRRFDVSTPVGRRNYEKLKSSMPDTFMAHHWRHSWKSTLR